MQKTTDLLTRIGLSAREARAEHGLSESELARLAGVSRRTLHRLEAGKPICPHLAVRVASVVTACDVFVERPGPAPIDQLVFDLGLERAARPSVEEWVS